MYGTDPREYRYQQEISFLKSKLISIESNISRCESYIRQYSNEISNLEYKIRNAENEAKQYLYGYNFSKYHDNYTDLMFHKNRIVGEYESEKRTKQSQLNSTQSELNRLNQEKSSVQNQISSSEREISRVQSENNWNKMLEENARKQKEQSSRQSQQIASQSLPSKQTAPVPLASPETIKNDLTDEQIIQMLKAHRKPTPTTLFGKKVTGFEKIELPQKTNNKTNIEVFTDNHFYPEAKITFADKETPKKTMISYIKKQIIPLRREGREKQ